MEKSKHRRSSTAPSTLEQGGGSGGARRPSVRGSGQTLVGSVSNGEIKKNMASQVLENIGNSSVVKTMLVSREAFVRISAFCLAIVLIGFLNVWVAIQDAVSISNGGTATSTTSPLGSAQTIIRAGVGIIYFMAMLSVREIRRTIWFFRSTSTSTDHQSHPAPLQSPILASMGSKRGSLSSIEAFPAATGEKAVTQLPAVIEATSEDD
ncbi:hypothetical protein HDU93_001247 [Gonapodya sp. JEL0774]|nr:hypothetical protein HDU93_001247 [Gonapodya sp. JEL0774]